MPGYQWHTLLNTGQATATGMSRMIAAEIPLLASSLDDEPGTVRFCTIWHHPDSRRLGPELANVFSVTDMLAVFTAAAQGRLPPQDLQHGAKLSTKEASTAFPFSADPRDGRPITPLRVDLTSPEAPSPQCAVAPIARVISAMSTELKVPTQNWRRPAADEPARQRRRLALRPRSVL